MSGPWWKVIGLWSVVWTSQPMQCCELVSRQTRAKWSLSPQLVQVFPLLLTTYLGPWLHVEHRPSTTPRHRTLFWANLAAPVQFVPCCLSSASVSRFQLLRGRPLFLFPCGLLDSWGCVQSSSTFSSEFVLLLVPVLLAPTALSFCWWRLTPLPKHQSQSVESPSGKWIPSSTLGVQLTDRGARTEISQPGLARPEQLLLCSRTSGRPRRSGQEPNFASSTPMWSQSCSTDAKLGGRQRQCYRKSRHSSTPVCGASTTSDGQRWPQMKVWRLSSGHFRRFLWTGLRLTCLSTWRSL